MAHGDPRCTAHHLFQTVSAGSRMLSSRSRPSTSLRCGAHCCTSFVARLWHHVALRVHYRARVVRPWGTLVHPRFMGHGLRGQERSRHDASLNVLLIAWRRPRSRRALLRLRSNSASYDFIVWGMLLVIHLNRFNNFFAQLELLYRSWLTLRLGAPPHVRVHLVGVSSASMDYVRARKNAGDGSSEQVTGLSKDRSSSSRYFVTLTKQRMNIERLHAEHLSNPYCLTSISTRGGLQVDGYH